MNLRKDHSHASKHLTTVNSWCESLCRGVSALPRYPCVADSRAAQCRMGGRLVSPPFCAGRHPFPIHTSVLCILYCLLARHTSCVFGSQSSSLQLSAIDVSARTTMKDAANCDKHCDLQNSVNQWSSERKLHFRDIPESMPASVSIPSSASDVFHLVWCSCLRVLVR